MQSSLFVLVPDMFYFLKKMDEELFGFALQLSYFSLINHTPVQRRAVPVNYLVRLVLYFLILSFFQL